MITWLVVVAIALLAVVLLVGGNDTYQSLCRRHWREAVDD